MKRYTKSYDISLYRLSTSLGFPGYCIFLVEIKCWHNILLFQRSIAIIPSLQLRSHKGHSQGKHNHCSVFTAFKSHLLYWNDHVSACNIFNVNWSSDARTEIKWGESSRGEARGTQRLVMQLMQSVIFLLKDNAAEQFNGPVSVITGRSGERSVRAHQKKLQVVCSAYKKREWE